LTVFPCTLSLRTFIWRLYVLAAHTEKYPKFQPPLSQTFVTALARDSPLDRKFLTDLYWVGEKMKNVKEDEECTIKKLMS
jgi:hypothetical protein